MNNFVFVGVGPHAFTGQPDGRCILCQRTVDDPDASHLTPRERQVALAFGSRALKRAPVEHDEWDPAFCRECGWLDCECEIGDDNDDDAAATP